MNSVTLGGKCWEPVVKTAQSGMIIFEVSMSVYDGKDRDGKPKYFNITVKAFKDVAEAAGDSSIDKGSQILVTGRLSQETWDDKQTGKKQYKTVLIADVIARDTRQFAKSKGDAAPASDPAGQFGQDVAPDDEIPF